MRIFNENICNDHAAATSREWLETNGIGGFACGTISGTNTRRYHALLTAAVDPPLGRISMLSKYEESVYVGGERFDLSSNSFPGVVHPEGYKLLHSFRLDPFPVWEYDLAGVTLEKRVFMVRGQNAVTVSWRILNNSADDMPDIRLEVRPLISFVDYHHLQHGNELLDGTYREVDGMVKMCPYADLPPIFFVHNGLSVGRSGYWYRNFEYAIERERGFDFREDLFQPFVLNFDLASAASIVASVGEACRNDVAELERCEVEYRRGLLATTSQHDEIVSDLTLAADNFIVRRGDGRTVIAGYPWFSDWGRDTMIALPGLTLTTGRHELARDIIVEFSKHISEGMIPNRFPDEGETADYNTVDATLWYFEAIRAYVAATGDTGVVRGKLYAQLANIIDWHLHGTRFNIHVDTDGLLFAGESGVQLTWMDAKIGDLVITPRTGKPVEIQALWYNALCVMSEFSKQCGTAEDTERFDDLAEMCRQSFNAAFWNPAENCLFDVVTNDRLDGSVRPNQIFAASLCHTMLDDERIRAVVDKVGTELLTPVGLRSLSPKDPKYCRQYIGSPFDRDSAYHQGTVWAWLTGGFVDAYRRAYPSDSDRVGEIIDGFRPHLDEAGIGQVSEIFDGDAPHAPRGCFAQAWSVAELLRVSPQLNR